MSSLRSLEPEVKEEEQDVSAVVNSDELVDVTISEIIDGTRFYLHYPNNDGLSTINDKMKAFGEVRGLDYMYIRCLS